MDRPNGPRPPPSNDRGKAFESIFGRPSAVHHQQQQPPPPPPLQNNRYYPSPDDSRSIYARPNSVHPHNRPSVYNPPYYPDHPPLHPHQSYRPQSLAPSANSVYAPGPSNYLQPGTIAPRPLDTYDPSLEQYTQPGMTPAQAYQAQIYQNPLPGPPIPTDHSRQWAPNPPSRAPIQYPHYSPPQQHQSPNGRNPHVLPHADSQSTFAVDDLLSDPTPTDTSRHYHLQAKDEDTASISSDTIVPPPSLRVKTSFPTSSSSPPTATASAGAASSRDSNGAEYSKRNSSDSIRTMPFPGPNVSRGRSPPTDRTRSFSVSASSPQARIAKQMVPPPETPPVPRSSALVTASRRPPIVYPALLSRVAEAFRARITLSERTKDGLSYTDAFDGREAVDKIAYIIKTTDRNLALLLGRALDAQKFFHDVTYDHRLRDSPNELFQFKTALSNAFVNGDGKAPGIALGESPHPDGFNPELEANRPSISPISTGERLPSLASDHSELSGTTYAASSTAATATSTVVPIVESPTSNDDNARVETIEEAPLPSGVFTLLTECYSPTCTRERLCYSIACPRRLEQQARLNMKQEGGLKRTLSRESLNDAVEPGTLWVHSVSQEVLDSVSDTEKKRQEAINEVVYTERDFVRDMEYLRDVWIKPLQTRDIIPEERRADFISQVFWNVHEIIAVNIKLRDALTKRQKAHAVVDRIGDILLEFVPHFEPFVKYGSHQLYGKYEFEKEKNSNPAFSQFVDEAERRPESRKLELNGYLTKPTTRLARYPLLLEVCLKYTADDNPDKVSLVKAVKTVREFLARVNIESGKTENRFNLLQLDQQLIFRPGEAEDLRLLDENRELVYKGPLKKRGGNAGDSGDLQLFLFDHALLIVKAKSKHEQFKVYRKPIPLELLVVTSTQDDLAGTLRASTNRPKSSLITKRNSTGRTSTGGPQLIPPIPPPKIDAKNGFPLTFTHLGRKTYTLTLWAATHISRKKWLENIAKQQDLIRERSMIFEPFTISQGFFIGLNRVNCAAPWDRGRRMIYGTDDGVYVSDLLERSREPMKVLGLLEVTQVDVLEDTQLLIVLAERSVITFPLEALDPRDPSAGLKRAKRVSTHTSFFKAGMCLGRTLVCVVKASALSTTIKTLEPIDQNSRGKNKPTFKKLLQGGNDTLRVFKEFYIPVESSSIHFLRTKLCVGCTKGFEIIDLETLDAQGLLDPNDVSLDFVQKRENVRPIAIYRVYTEFLLCYEDFAFYIDKNGWRSRPGWIIHWEGTPTAFALHYPYVLAFEPTFVEIRHVETGQMAQVIPGSNLACLFADTPPSSNTAVQHSSIRSHHGGPHNDASLGYYGRPNMPTPHLASPNTRAPQPRDQIIIAMDEKVMALRLALPPIPDGASLRTSR